MFSSTVLKLFDNPQNVGAMDNPDAIGQAGTPGGGPYMTVYLRTADELIADASFQTYCCPTIIACGSWLTQWVKGKTFDAAEIIEPNDLTTVLGGLPLGKEHCAEMTIKALRSALYQLEEYRQKGEKQ